MSQSVQLGDLLALGNSSSTQLSAWLNAVDPPLGARLQQAAAERGESLAQFVRIAVSDFLAEADEEAWASLLSALRDAFDPGAACLDRVASFRFGLERA